MSKYRRKIARNEEGMSDVYDVLTAFGVTNPATAHAIKKLLMPGQRGNKGTVQDLQEAGLSISRAVEIEIGTQDHAGQFGMTAEQAMEMARMSVARLKKGSIL